MSLSTNHLMSPGDGLSSAALDCIEQETQRLGRELFSHFRDTEPHIWQRRWWDDRLMAWSMQDEAVKVELFRFVDVLPMLHDSTAVLNHLQQYLDRAKNRLPIWLREGLRVTRQIPGVRNCLASLVRLGASDFARKFIAGTNTQEVLAVAARERKQGRAFTLDILGEAVITETEAEQHARAYCDLITAVSPAVNGWSTIPQLDSAPFGSVPRVNISIKLSALDAKFDAIDPRGTMQRAGARLREILRVARQHQAFINVDMESYEKKDLTLQLFREVLSEPEFREVCDVGIVIQCYLRDSAADLLALRDWARARGTPIWVRLVKGAYWDYETVTAQARGWPIPVYQRKPESDANYERLTRIILQNTQHLRPAFGSHNLRSLAHAIATAKQLELPPGSFEVQMLYGMADAEKHALVEQGQRLRIYMPFGELIPGMAYLVRRLLENTSNDSFLRAGFLEHETADKLLKNPLDKLNTINIPPATNTTTAASATIMTTPSLHATFENHPPVDFSRSENREKMLQALADVRSQCGRHFPIVINGEKIDTAEKIVSVDPSQFERTVGTSAKGTREHADQAVQAAHQALRSWWAFGAEARARCLQRAADHLQRRLFEISAWEVYECGKTCREATADVDEAIDFLRYYAEQAIKLQHAGGADVPGEQNRFEYMPRGVVGVIAPWNFPLAILTGMSAAALATGNTVVMKPAETAIVMGGLLQEVFDAAGIPAGVVNYLPGEGSVVGAALVEHPRVAMIVFTGSRQVGLAINAKAAEVSQHAPQVKRVVAEMGGKNAIIIDDSADLDEAVLAVVRSAFGFQGQKCSACSRVIVLPSVYETFIARLVAATKTLHVGPADDPATDIGPVIDAAALAKVQEYIAIGRTEGKEYLSMDVDSLAKRGYFVGPCILGDVTANARIAQEEVFGPVLAVIKAGNFDEALRIANGTEFALTGGIFSRTPEHLDRARREFVVGNLYLNRGITGALVGRHPFGGFKMSGIGSKAGGPDYLLQFVLPRVVTENTLRRGFAPVSE